MAMFLHSDFGPKKRITVNNVSVNEMNYPSDKPKSWLILARSFFDSIISNLIRHDFCFF